MIQLTSLNLPAGYCEADLERTITKAARREAKRFRKTLAQPICWRIKRKSLDARRTPPVWKFNVEVAEAGEFFLPPSGVQALPLPNLRMDEQVIIVGAGPCGYFAALDLARSGFKPLVLEQGGPVDERRIDVYDFWRGAGSPHPYNNVQFGEGGAGTFSDGKLTTGVKHPRKQEVLEEFVCCGADPDILYNAAPHIGTDVLSKVMATMRQHISDAGGQVLFYHKLQDIEVSDNAVRAVVVENVQSKSLRRISCNRLVLALGHSARDTVKMLAERGVAMEAKPFAAGLRIEHPQMLINTVQYHAAEIPEICDLLPPAAYKLSTHLADGRGVFTFCMCPGGFVVAAASGKEQVVTNGMSRSNRAARRANSALLVGLNPDDFGGDSDPLAGFMFQAKLEKSAFLAGGSDYYAPAQTVGDFLAGKLSSYEEIQSASYRPGVRTARLDLLLPRFMADALRDGIVELDRKLDGFANPQAILTGVESRSSSPVRILRCVETLQSSISGLFPAGEGAGFAGGIMSAALDGLKVADRIKAD